VNPLTQTNVDVVRVAVAKPLHQLFDYAVPPDMTPPVAGARVVVPFGRQRLTAICVERNPDDAHAQLKPLLSVLDDTAAIPEELRALAGWLCDYYQHPLGEVLATMLPAEARRGHELTIVRPEQWTATGTRSDLARAPRQQALMEALAAAGGTLSASALAEAGFSRALIRAAAGKGLITRTEAATGFTLGIDEQPPELSDEQAGVLSDLLARTDCFAPSLLEGITGSGKTEIYLQLIDNVRKAGHQVLVLVPEIALTPQTVGRFERRFGSGGGVASLHSNLGDQERLQTWLKCRSGEVSVLIGTRSAVFAPFAKLGLIVVDEEHDGSFKQQDGLRYSARDVAVKRAQTLDIPLLLGSATPSLESLNNAMAGRYAHLRLRHRAGGARPPRFHLLDIRGQSLDDGLSQDLLRIVGQHLNRGGQALVFLNRRGYAPTYLCPRCSWQAACGHCEMRLTLHLSPRALLCHHCGHQRPLPSACPDCGHAELIAVGAGTQRTEAGLAKRFPGIPLYRVDRDTTRSQRRMEAQFEAIHKGDPAILVGTQMLAKGHHFPKVTVVAVVNADGGFLSADYRAPERTAQLITQVAGRAGRAEDPGEVWIQTYQPDGVLLRSLIDEGYDGFARRELAIRKSSGLPPFRPMALLRAESRDAESARNFLTSVRDRLGSPLEVLGPAPAPIARVANRLRFQLMVMADSRRELHAGIRPIRDLTAPGTIRWSVDIDPYDTF
jgi:primosomal protein N' (replication factor Y)